MSLRERSETRGFVSASPRPTVALRHGAQYGPISGVLLGMPVALFGSIVTVMGAVYSFGFGRREELAGQLLLLGSGMAVGGAVLVGWGASEGPAGVVEWQVD